MSASPPAAAAGGRTWERVVPAMLALGFVLRFAWPLADIPPRTSWSNGIYTDPAVMVHAARNACLFGHWVLDYNRDLWVFPLMNALTWLFYLPAGPGRLPTVLLSALAGTATIAAVAWTLRRSLGARAAALGAVLFAVANFPVMFARVPIAENVTALLLVLAAGSALGRTRRALASAGALAVGATLLGKLHAIGFLPGLMLFVVLRDRSVRSAAAVVAGGIVVFLPWLLLLFLPHREQIVTHVEQQSTGLHGTWPLLASLPQGAGEFFNAVRRSWFFFRMPVAGTVGGLFAIWSLGNGTARAARLRDGTLVHALALASLWIYYALLPYKAPRYYVLLAPFLAAAAAAGLELALRSGDVAFRPPARRDEHLPLALWVYAFCFTAIDAVKHAASIALDWLTLPPARISPAQYDAAIAVFSRLDTFRQGLIGAGAAGIVLYVAILWNPEILRSFRHPGRITTAGLRRLVAVLVALEVAIGLGSWVWFAVHRTSSLEAVKSSFPSMIGEEAVVLGPLAPALTQDTRFRCLPYFGPPGSADLLSRYGVTHLFVGGKGDREVLESRFPGLLDSTRIVQVWPLRTLFASTLELRRLPESWQGVKIHDYRPTTYEVAADAASAGAWEDALAGFRKFRQDGGRETPELVSLEAVCWFKLERYDEAGKLLDRAIAMRPDDPLNWRNLGVLHLRRGERAEALDALMRSYRLDPENEDLRKMIEELRR